MPPHPASPPSGGEEQEGGEESGGGDSLGSQLASHTSYQLAARKLGSFEWFCTLVLATVIDSSSTSGSSGASTVMIFWKSPTSALRLAGSVSTLIFSTRASTSSVWKPEAL